MKDSGQPTVTVMVEIKKSDGNYGTRSGAAYVSVPVGASAELIADAMKTVDECFDALRRELASKFKNGEAAA